MEENEKLQFDNEFGISDFFRDIKIKVKVFKRLLYLAQKKYKIKKQKVFKEILYVTKGDIPLDYVSAFRKQYPDKEIKILMPLDVKTGFHKLHQDFELYFQNRITNVSIYKKKIKDENIIVYGLYSDAFSGRNLEKLQYLIPFIKAARIAIKTLKPNIVHSDNIPFFLGSEFEKKFPCQIKVVQVFDDLTKFEKDKIEMFWAAINLADAKAVKKICSDGFVKKYLNKLFHQKNSIRFNRIEECLEFLYNNYDKFRELHDIEENLEENLIFNKLNTRIAKLFPKIICKNKLYYNPLFNTLKQVNTWAVSSETYYNELIKNHEFWEMFPENRKKIKEKSAFVKYGYKPEEATIFQEFSQVNFRETRELNKKYLVREFSKARIKIKFVDSKLFKTEEYQIRGHLDTYPNAALIFCKFSNNIFKDGADIALTTMLKLFEQYKNVQLIVNIPKGLEVSNIQSWVEFMENNSIFNGRWLFIDGEVNLPQFYASSDIALFPSRENTGDTAHYVAMKYGCIPIVAQKGIYNDTVKDIFDDMVAGCGFKAVLSIESDDDACENFYSVVHKALNIYKNNHSSWNLIIANAMNYDSDWNFDVICKYNQIYEEVS